MKQDWIQAGSHIAGLAYSWTGSMVKCLLRDYLYSQNVECPFWYLWCLAPSYLGILHWQSVSGHIICQIFLLQSLLLWHKHFCDKLFCLMFLLCVCEKNIWEPWWRLKKKRWWIYLSETECARVWLKLKLYFIWIWPFIVFELNNLNSVFIWRRCEIFPHLFTATFFAPGVFWCCFQLYMDFKQFKGT